MALKNDYVPEIREVEGQIFCYFDNIPSDYRSYLKEHYGLCVKRGVRWYWDQESKKFFAVCEFIE